jgi:hypothetical protein
MNELLNIGFLILPILAMYLTIKIVVTYKRKADNVFNQLWIDVNNYIKDKLENR